MNPYAANVNTDPHKASRQPPEKIKKLEGRYVTAPKEGWDIIHFEMTACPFGMVRADLEDGRTVWSLQSEFLSDLENGRIKPDGPQAGDECVVQAPEKFPSSRLNGVHCRVLENVGRVSTTIILTGKHAGREWCLLNDHLLPLF